jgi:hypothetical protein
MMKKNMGQADKGIRIAVALLIGVLYGSGILSGAMALVLGIVAVVFVATSFISWCPLYAPLGISTCSRKS